MTSVQRTYARVVIVWAGTLAALFTFQWFYTR